VVQATKWAVVSVTGDVAPVTSDAAGTGRSTSAALESGPDPVAV